MTEDHYITLTISLDDLEISALKEIIEVYIDKIRDVSELEIRFNDEKKIAIFNFNEEDYIFLDNIQLLISEIIDYKLKEDFQELYKKQEEELRIKKFARLEHLFKIALEGNKKLELKLFISISKKKYLQKLVEGKSINIELWIDNKNLIGHWNKNLTDLRYNLQPTIICLNDEVPNASEYLRFINLNCKDEKVLKERLDKEIEKLSKKIVTWKNIIARSQKNGNSNNYDRIPPIQFLVNEDLLVNRLFDYKVEKYIQASKLFLLALFKSISDEFIVNSNKIFFHINRDQKLSMKIELDVLNNFLVNSETKIELDDQMIRRTIELYSVTLHNETTNLNSQLIYNAIVFVGGSRIENFILKAQDIIKYYDFQKKILLEEKFTEQSEVIKSYLVSYQELKNKIMDTVNSISQNMTTILTTVIGIILVAFLSFNNDRILDFCFYTTLFFHVAYIPVYYYRAYKMCYSAIANIDNYFNDLDYISLIQGYPLHNIFDKAKEKDIKKELKQELIHSYSVLNFFLVVLFIVSNITNLWIGLNKDYYNTIFIVKDIPQYIYKLIIGLVVLLFGYSYCKRSIRIYKKDYVMMFNDEDKYPIKKKI